MVNNPRQAGEDQVDYVVRVTRIARDEIAKRNPQAETFLQNRLAEIEDLKNQVQSAREQSLNTSGHAPARVEQAHH
jgi:hypothetical protein